MFLDSDIERYIDKMFSCESLGFEDDESQYDTDKIQEFKDNIEYDNGCYWVKLAWYPDKIKAVPSNHGVALKVLDRVVDKLTKMTPIMIT